MSNCADTVRFGVTLRVSGEGGAAAVSNGGCSNE